MTESKSKFKPRIEFDTEMGAEGTEMDPFQPYSWIRVHTHPGNKMYFLSLLVSNNISLGELIGLIGRKSGKSFEDSEEVRKAFHDFIAVVAPRRFGPQAPNKKQTKRQSKMEEMFKEIQEKEQGWSQEEVQKLYELFEEVQEELSTETD